MSGVAETFLSPILIFLTFFFICAILVEGKFAQKGTILFLITSLIGVFVVHLVLIYNHQDPMFILTILPLTAYVPMIMSIHLLSKAGFFQSIAIWTMGLFANYILTFLQKILIVYSFSEHSTGRILLCLLVVACFLIWLCYRYIQKPFRLYVLQNNTNWIPLCFPILMIFLLFSYFKNSTTNVLVWILIFLTALSIFLVLTRVLVSVTKATRIQKEKDAVSKQLCIQQAEYETICKKMELGKLYRHDMRHHLAALSTLAQGKNNQEIMRYIKQLNDTMDETVQKEYCENVMVNAMLSSYIHRAKEAGCSVNTKLFIPPSIPYDALDICTILANGIENAIHACSNDVKKEIYVHAMMEANQKLAISITNPCDTKLQFDEEGFPKVERREGHGLGLKSIKTIVDKYKGLFQCRQPEDTFELRIILFHRQEGQVSKKSFLLLKRHVSTTVALLFLVGIAWQWLPGIKALGDVSVFGDLFQVADGGVYDLQWGDNELHSKTAKVTIVGRSDSNKKTEEEVKLKEESQVIQVASPSGNFSWDSEHDSKQSPSIEVLPQQPTKTPESITSNESDIAEGVDDMNREMDRYLQTIREKFLWYVARKYNGYVASDSTYYTIRNDDELLVIRFDTTINAGGSGEFSRHFILDKKSGELLELQDLFVENSEYVKIMSTEVLKQMREQVQSGVADYFITGGIWQDEECFQQMEVNQNFYINENNQIVIVFDEYEVAPGSQGKPEFIIPTQILTPILKTSS